MVDEATFRTRVLAPLFDLGEGAPEPALSAGVRRLWFEAHSIMIQDLRRRIDRTDDEPPRRIPAVEREERKSELATRLGEAFRMEGELEPANFLIDRYVQLAEDGQLEWVPWEECPKREQELQQGRGRKRWMADASGVIKEKEVPADTRADVSTALRIQWAMKRRGLALDIAGLLYFSVHEELVD